MKRYIVFIFSFLLLYIVTQIVSGWVLTTVYSPSVSLTDNYLSQEVVFGQTSIIPIIATLTIATLAYCVSHFVTFKK